MLCNKKEYNVIVDYANSKCKLLYLINDHPVKVFAEYDIIKPKITELIKFSVDLAILTDINNLSRAGFQHNPHLTDNN